MKRRRGSLSGQPRHPSTRPATIASLYALADDGGTQPKQSVGFGD